MGKKIKLQTFDSFSNSVLLRRINEIKLSVLAGSYA